MIYLSLVFLPPSFFITVIKNKNVSVLVLNLFKCNQPYIKKGRQTSLLWFFLLFIGNYFPYNLTLEQSLDETAFSAFSVPTIYVSVFRVTARSHYGMWISVEVEGSGGIFAVFIFVSSVPSMSHAHVFVLVYFFFFLKKKKRKQKHKILNS